MRGAYIMKKEYKEIFDKIKPSKDQKARLFENLKKVFSRPKESNCELL